MKSFKRNAVRFLPLLILPMAFAIGGTAVKSAADLPPAPCMGDAMTVASSLGKMQNPAPVQKKTVPRNLAILIFDRVDIIDYAGPYNLWSGSLLKD